MSYWGVMKRIRVMDKVLIIFAGRPGFDAKLIIKPLQTNRHYTISLRHGLDPSMNALPVDVHMTKEGPDKAHVPIGKGTFNLRKVADDLIGGPGPIIEEIDLEAPQWKNRELVSLDERLLKLLGSKELRIPSMLGEELMPKPAYQLSGSRLALGFDTDRDIPGMIVKADARSIALGLPGIKGLQERLEDSLKWETFNEGVIEDESALDEAEEE